MINESEISLLQCLEFFNFQNLHSIKILGHHLKFSKELFEYKAITCKLNDVQINIIAVVVFKISFEIYKYVLDNISNLILNISRSTIQNICVTNTFNNNSEKEVLTYKIMSFSLK